MATVEITPEAADQFSEIREPIRTRMLKLMERLKSWPDVSGVKPLSGPLAGHYRLRTGDYRMQFHVVGEVVVIEKIGHRDGFYEE
jgi:mRNA interferase RelE/StbE